MYSENHPPDDVRDMFHDVRARWRARWATWVSISPTEWSSTVRWGLAIAAALTGFFLAWSIGWLTSLPARAALKQGLEVERQMLARAKDAADQLPSLMRRLQNEGAQTRAWQRMLPVVEPGAEAFAGASEGESSASSTVSKHASDAPEVDDEALAAWRTDLERLVSRSGLTLAFSRPGPAAVSGELETERAELRVRGTVANLLGWLAEVDRLPRHLVVEQFALDGPRVQTGTTGGATHPESAEASLSVTVSAYRWRRTAEPAESLDMPMTHALPALPEPPPRWEMPTDAIDVFRTPMTRRSAQDAVTMTKSMSQVSVESVESVGAMRAGARRVVLRRTATGGLLATWSDDGALPGRALSNTDPSAVDVVLHGAEAADALRVFARLTGRSVAIGERVTGRLDMEVTGVSAATAFEVMIRSAGLGVQSVNGVDWIAPRADLLADERTQLEAAAKREALQPLAARRFRLNYPRAEALREIILGQKDSKGQRLLSARGGLIADPRTNQLFVTDLPERLDALASFIARIDVPVRQVLIEARIVEADDGFSESLGVRLAGQHGAATAGRDGDKRPTSDTGSLDMPAGGRVANGGARGTGGDTSAPGSAVDVGLSAAALAGVTPPSLAITLFGRSASRFLQLELSALETSGRGRVVSRPRVVTADKVQALIEQGTELPYQTRNGRRNVASVQFRKATLRLEVTPLITPDGQVILDVDVRKDSVGQAVGEGFAVDTRHVRTQVQVESGGTVAIGGIYQEVKRDSRASVPWLGDVPVLGALFRNRANENRRTELLVFLTPSVVPDGAAVGAPSALDDGTAGRGTAALERIALAEAVADVGEVPDVPEVRDLPGASASAASPPVSDDLRDDVPPGHPRLLGVFPEATRSARPTQIPVSSGIGTQISAIYAGKRNTCRTDGSGQDHGWTRSGTTSWTAVL
ncbi:Type IV pilus biogenesis and competence protein PilQ [Pandoraea anapnoica]|uniref:Type IV pilus biogenesis and competence protein PilQ n=1 Tax=Pandoraea anapnoica TaxID=2508301 RepID=A0A5E5ANF4_9BURK|nr:type IV pilus secretin PilQ [Pandoraea anapnoica]VVE74322.1 Type IV pilus biogenesis and competence protein PilQ [Pandoraea anapnoica]